MKGYSYRKMNLIMTGTENFGTDREDALLWRIT